MPITPEQGQEILARLARNKARGKGEPIPDDAVDDEIPLHKDIISWCDEQFPKVPFVHSRTDKRTRNRKGIVDFIIGFRGQTYWIECKKKDGKRSPEQLIFSLLLEMQGIKPHICRSMAEFHSILTPPVESTSEAVGS